MHKAAPQCLKPPQGVGCGLHHGPPNTGLAHGGTSAFHDQMATWIQRCIKSTAKYPVVFL